MIRSRILLWVSVLAGVGSVVIPFWPLSLLAIVSAVFGRYIVVALMLGVFFDVLYGVPSGFVSFLYIPFTLFALSSVIVRYVISSVLRKPLTDRL